MAMPRRRAASVPATPATPAVPPVLPVVQPTPVVLPPPVRPVAPVRPVTPRSVAPQHYIRVPIQAPGPMRPVGQTAWLIMVTCAVIGVIALFYGAFALGGYSVPLASASVAVPTPVPVSAPLPPPVVRSRPPVDPCDFPEPNRREHFLRLFQDELEMCP